MAIGNNGYTPPRPLTTADVVDNLMSSAADLPLSARQGSVLDGKLEQLSNPNLLINPDFRINQRGKTEYNAVGYTVDRWTIQKSKLTVLEKGVKIKNVSGAPSLLWITQKFERNPEDNVTVSMKFRKSRADMQLRFNEIILRQKTTDWQIVTGITAYKDMATFVTDLGATADDYIEIEWIKLEYGSISTPFIPPDPATELLKCQRYYVSPDEMYSFISTLDGDVPCLCNIQFPVEMRIKPTVKFVSAKGTPDTLSDFASLLDTETTAIPNYNAMTNRGFCAFWAGNSIKNAGYVFRYIADAEIY